MYKTEMSFPVAGQIRLGESKRKSDKGGTIVGRDLGPKFRVVFFPGMGRWKDMFSAAYPKAERTPGGDFLVEELRVFLPFPSIESLWSWTNEAHSAACMLCQADNDHYVCARDPKNLSNWLIKDGTPYKKFTVGDTFDYAGSNGKQQSVKVKARGRLTVCLADLPGAFVSFDLVTTGFYHCASINAGIGGIYSVAAMLNKNNIAGVPFYLNRVQREITWNKPDGPVRTKQHIVTLTSDPVWAQNAMQRMTSMALGEGSAPVYALPEPPAGYSPEDDIDDDEEEAGSEPESTPAVVTVTEHPADYVTPSTQAAQKVAEKVNAIIDGEFAPEEPPLPEEEAAPAKRTARVTDEAAMTIEQAEAFINSKGQKYGSIESDVLLAMIQTMLDKNDDTLNERIAAAKTIVTARRSSGRAIQK